MSDWSKELGQGVRRRTESEHERLQSKRVVSENADKVSQRTQEIADRIKPVVMKQLGEDALESAAALTMAGIVTTKFPSEAKKIVHKKEHPPLTKGSLFRGLLSRLVSGNSAYISNEPQSPIEGWLLKKVGHDYLSSPGSEKDGHSSSLGPEVASWIFLTSEGGLGKVTEWFRPGHQFLTNPSNMIYAGLADESSLLKLGEIVPDENLSATQQPLVQNFRQCVMSLLTPVEVK